MEVNGAVPASAGTVTFTGIVSIALLGSFFISDFSAQHKDDGNTKPPHERHADETPTNVPAVYWNEARCEVREK